MGRIIAFDIGDKRVGVSISDPFGEMALPLETYWRKGFDKDIAYLLELAKNNYAEVIVCGLPVNFDGSRSVQTDRTEEFILGLKNISSIPIVTQDERFTTIEAERILIGADMRREKRKNVVDKIAASYILEDYLARIKNNINK